MKKLALYTLSSLGLSLTCAAFATDAHAQDQGMAPPPPMTPPPAQPAPMQTPSPAQPGMMAPPPPMDPNATNPSAQTSTKTQLEAADKQDNGRNFELIYVNADIGASYINMTQFSSNPDSLGLVSSSAAGPMFSLSAGVRLVLLTLGVRARLNQLSSFSMWQLNAEVGLKIPIKLLDVYIMAHGGYDFLGSLNNAALSADTAQSSSDVTVRGFNVGLDAGVDYYLVPLFSIGAGVTADFLSLNRPQVALPAELTGQLTPQQQQLYNESASSFGFGFAAGVRLGLHFGL